MGVGRKKQLGEAQVIGNQKGRWGYLIAWEFRPKPGVESRFEDVYGTRGIWANFFMQGEGFIGTELNRDLKDPRRYLTLDLWVSKEAYDKFQAEHLAEYRTIDARCEQLTEHETELGRFERLG
jgi:heme-degrading monooxygenase HmoA